LKPEHFLKVVTPPPAPLRNRRIGDFLNELRLVEARGTDKAKTLRFLNSPIREIRQAINNDLEILPNEQQFLSWKKHELDGLVLSGFTIPGCIIKSVIHQNVAPTPRFRIL
jgi:hypothetical protein